MKTRSFLLSILFILSIVSFAAAQDAILLEHKFTPGESVNYAISVDSNSLFTLYGLEKKIAQQSFASFKMSEDPTTTTKNALAFILEILDESVTSEGEKTDLPKGVKVNLKMTKAGKITETSDPTKLQYFQDMIVSFPEKPVKAGEEWKIETPFKIQNPDSTETELKAVLKCKVIEFKKFENRNCAVIETNLSVADEKTKTSELKAEASGRMYFDHENGKIVAINNTIELDIKTLDENAPSKKIPASTLKSKIQVKLTLK